MIDHSLIKLIPADESHREFSYQAKKATEGGYITQIWGWDEERERDFHTRDWQQSKPEIIVYKGKAIGTIAVTKNEDTTEIGQFFILPKYQNKGIGSHLLQNILRETDRTGRVSKLKFLKNNPAKSLYLRHGFVIVKTNEFFYFTERKPDNNASV